MGVELFGVSEGDHLPSVFRHLGEDEGHLLLGEEALLDLLTGEGGEEVAIGAREADAVVLGGGLDGLFLGRLVLGVDADKGLDRPRLVGGEHLANVGENFLFCHLHENNYDRVL